MGGGAHPEIPMHDQDRKGKSCEQGTATKCRPLVSGHNQVGIGRDGTHRAYHGLNVRVAALLLPNQN